ncbi:MAG: bifunctional folylpolyglutamate synthase/dihydrofolate synthase [Anaerolineae bacterium]|nr:bifunctional folylpolyglutamate synthase/dihydrofolate synthase [Anaerolineae bacterium]
MLPTLSDSLARMERLITRPAESYTDPLERQAEFRRRLDRTRALFACLGDPLSAFPKGAIHITGTSGKGSVAMFCESILREHGLKVGTHTSPYLQTPLEKVRVDGRVAPPERVIPLVERVLGAVTQVQHDRPDLGQPHYAEAWFALAALDFAEQGCDVAVIEVGMGGRYDCTNILSGGVSVINSVHYDHVRVLGETLPEIAHHKAGIIKPGLPAIAGVMAPEALAVVEAEARQQGAPLSRLGYEITCTPLAQGPDGEAFSYRSSTLALDGLRTRLIGAHQINNAAAALAACEAHAALTGMPLDAQAARRGIERTRFAGRIEVIPGVPSVLLDGAHNEEKIAALVQAIRASLRPRGRVIAVAALLESKNAGPIAAMLAGAADQIITTETAVRGKPAITAADLAALINQAAPGKAEADSRPQQALDRALALAGPDDLVVVTGSLYLIGEVRSRWFPVERIIAQSTMFPQP